MRQVHLPGDRGLGICFVAHNAYGALCGSGHGQIGGIEHQQALIAKWLAERGHRVTMLTWDEDPPLEQAIGRVQAIPICRRDAGIRGFRFFHPRWTGLTRALRRADADVYYHNCGEYVTGQVALWCQRHGRKFVYSVASDPDCDPRLPEMHTFRERMLYRYGLRHADRVVVQTRGQQRMLREGFGLEPTVIPMPCVGPREEAHVPPHPQGPETRSILWLGRVCKVKRPDRLLEIALAMPAWRVDFVGPPDGSNYTREVCTQAERVPNLTVHGAVPADVLLGLYRKAFCLCCTSDFEGFPNTFLEAWSHGLPVVSTVDPDHLITERSLGVVASDVPGLVAGIRRLGEDLAFYEDVSRNARRYYAENHTVEAVMPQFERLFLDVVSEGCNRGLA